MHYKTICLELLKDQYPTLHENLRQQRMLLQAVTDYASALKSRHDHWKTEFRQANPDRDPAQISSEALEMAIEDLQASLPPESSTDETETLSLDPAMDFIRRHTPPA
jgi:chromosome segregation ATPase